MGPAISLSLAWFNYPGAQPVGETRKNFFASPRISIRASKALASESERRRGQ